MRQRDPGQHREQCLRRASAGLAGPGAVLRHDLLDGIDGWPRVQAGVLDRRAQGLAEGSEGLLIGPDVDDGEPGTRARLGRPGRAHCLYPRPGRPQEQAFLARMGHRTGARTSQAMSPGGEDLADRPRRPPSRNGAARTMISLPGATAPPRPAARASPRPGPARGPGQPAARASATTSGWPRRSRRSRRRLAPGSPLPSPPHHSASRPTRSSSRPRQTCPRR